MRETNLRIEIITDTSISLGFAWSKFAFDICLPFVVIIIHRGKNNCGARIFGHEFGVKK